ncbi:MAG: NAD(P)/FAD-dependent oxidoreductase [Cyanobacteriota bacterium]|nr:NAD(P)/FAD-dependent oxidoreductase [Cyanobacteriota bacterium]
MASASPSTLILGGGFGGLWTALHLRHRRHSGQITLIDAQERFVFKPLLYELLTEELPEDVICPAYRDLLVNSDIRFIQGEAIDIRLRERRVELRGGQSLEFDSLVLALGAAQGYLGTEGAEEYGFPFRSREQALALKAHLKACLTEALETEDPRRKQALLTVAIVGAGPAGVEMAATLADLLPNWYAAMGGKLRDLRLYLINHAPRILAGDANSGLQREALRAFKERLLPVTLQLGTGVKAVGADFLDYQTAGETEIQRLETATTIWTAGAAVNPLLACLQEQLPPEERDRHGQPLVTPTLQLLGFPQIFGCGDCVAVQGDPQPALAQIAYQQGAVIAHNLLALERGEALQSSRPALRGTLMKLGLGNGVANLFDKMKISGAAGDLLRNATYLELLPTPLHNFNATRQWLAEETVNRYHHPHGTTPEALKLLGLSPARRRERSWVQGLALAAPILFALGVVVGLQTPPQEQAPFQPLPSSLQKPR